MVTLLWLQQFYDMFERLGLRSNCVSCARPSTFPFILFWINVSLKGSDVNIV